MSDDLISRKALLENLRSRKYIDMPLREGFESIVDWQPTAYDVDKVIEKLENRIVQHEIVKKEKPQDIYDRIHNVSAKSFIRAYKAAMQIHRTIARKVWFRWKFIRTLYYSGMRTALWRVLHTRNCLERLNEKATTGEME